MVPNAAVGANQAIEFSVVLMNELQNAIRDEGNGRWTSNGLAAAIARYMQMRKSRAQMAFEKAALAYRRKCVMTDLLKQF